MLTNFDGFESITRIHRSSFHGPESRQRPSSWNVADDHMEPPGDHHEQYHQVSRIDLHERATLTDGDSGRYDTSREQRQYYTDSNIDRDEVLQMQKRISMLERQLTSAANARAINHRSGTDTLEIDPSQAIDDAPEDRLADGTEQERFIAQIVKRDWKEFTNKYGDSKHEYAIELLMRDTDLHHHFDPDFKGDRRKGDSSLTNHQEFFHVSSERIPKVVPARARINSPWILKALARINSEIDPGVPLVMLRPWKFLAHYEQNIRDIVQNISEKNGAKSGSSTTASEATAMPELTTVPGQAMPMENDLRCLNENQHLQCLIAFIDEYIKPMREQFEGTAVSKVRFKDLWFLFKPGDDVYMPIKVRGRILKAAVVNWTAEAFQGRYERMWRVTATTGGYWNPPADRTSHARSKPSPFKVSCYYIDFDGKYFLPVTHTFSIMPFEGEEEITSLDFYPVRYTKDQSQVMGTGSRQGQRIFESLSRRSTHYYYTGPTLVVHPCGCPIQGDTLNQEHIESEVIVDFATSLLSFPSWRPRASLWKPPVRPRRHEESVTRHWLNRSQPTPLGEVHDRVYDDYSIDLQRAINFREHEMIFAPVPTEWLSNRSRVPEKDVILLTYRGFAFVLRSRTFAPVSLWHLHEIKPQADGLQNLQLKDNTVKEGIRALVRTHFRHEEAKKTGADFEYDIVRGKGKGLVILLHGAPGVGKSSTAESIAAANGRPLFQITCGDLGLTPKEVETALKEIFRYAQMWKCILLLDECDIFLAARTKGDIQRNSLVSVFLRVLEFYSGVLFLTTNRVGVLDDAVRSRIAWAIYYPPLDEKQTRTIWKGNLDLLAERNKDVELDRKGIMRFAKHHFETSTEAQPNWNGRQIQNAFKVATALAEWEVMTEEERYGLDLKVKLDGTQPKIQLRPSHFQRIAAGTLAFDRYIHEVTGTSEAQRAWNMMERADDHNPENNEDEIGNDFVSPPSGDLNRSPFSNPRRDWKPPTASSPVSMKSPDHKTSHSRKRSASGVTPSYLLSLRESSGGTFTSTVQQSPKIRRLSNNMSAGQSTTTSTMPQPSKRRSEAKIAVGQLQSVDPGYERDVKRQRLYEEPMANDESDGSDGWDEDS